MQRTDVSGTPKEQKRRERKEARKRSNRLAVARYREKMKREDPDRYRSIVKKQNARECAKRKAATEQRRQERAKAKASQYMDPRTAIDLKGSFPPSGDHPQPEHNVAMGLTATSIDVSEAEKRKKRRKSSYDFQSALHEFQQIPYTQHGYWKGSPPNIRTPSFSEARGRESSPETSSKVNTKEIKGHDLHSTWRASPPSQDSIMNGWLQAWHGHGDMLEKPGVGRLRAENTIKEQRTKKFEAAVHVKSQIKNMEYIIKSSPSRETSPESMTETNRKSSQSAERSKSMDSEMKDWQEILDMWHRS